MKQIYVDPTAVEPARFDGEWTSMTVAIGDGITVRVLEDGTLRVKSKNHRIVLDWCTNKAGDGEQSIVGLKLTRKVEK
jgi:hypothetical protein